MITEKDLDPDKMPRHIAIIMDGNGRWAKNKGMMRVFGHQSGTRSVKDVIEGCVRMNIPYLTLYAFSNENWGRPQDEVDALMRLLATTLKKELPMLQENGISLHAIGNLDKLPVGVRKSLRTVMIRTKANKKLILTLALSYGARQEIENCVKNIARKVAEKKLDVDKITTETIAKNLYDPNMPDVDIMIRTSGEQRISNFLLWHLAYAELIFTPTLWPDFRKEDLYQAVQEYQKRERRFGKTSEQIHENP